MSRSKKTIIVVFAVAACFSLVNFAHAAIVTFSNEQMSLNGQGFGAAPPILTVQAKGSATTECGSVYWDGITDQITDDASAGKCQTITAGSLLNAGVTRDTLGLLLNINEPLSETEKDLKLTQFTVKFYNPAGGVILNAPFNSGVTPLALVNSDSGQGKTGWVFRIELSSAEWTSVFGNQDNRIGITVLPDSPFTDVGDGADDFRMGAIPEPATVTLLGLGLALFGRRRK